MDHFFRRHFGHIPVQRLLAMVFAALLLLSVGSAAWLLISSGNRIVGRVVADSADATSRQALQEIARFLKTPAIIGESVQNALRERYIELQDRDAVSRFLYQLPQRDADYGVSGVYIADAAGNLTGVDADLQDGVPQWSVLLSSPAADARLNKYAVGENGAPGELLQAGAPFDATDRPWYKQAVGAQTSVWTDLYLDAHRDQPVLTWTRAYRDDSDKVIAVVGVDLLVARVRQFLAQLPISANTVVFLTDRNGALIASSGQPAADEAIPGAQQVLDHLADRHAGIAAIDDVFEAQLTIQATRGLLRVMPAGGNAALAWRVGVFVPMSDYVSSLGSQLMRIVPLALLTLAIVWFALQMSLRLTVMPLRQLRDSANRIADGCFNVFIDTACRNEVGQLAGATETMRQRLKRAFDDINEQKIAAQTTLGSIADGVVAMDADGVVKYLNRAAEQQCGVRSEAVVGKPVQAVLQARASATGEPLDAALIASVIAADAPRDCNYYLRDSHGRQRTVECCISPLRRKANSTASGAVMVFSDVTEQVELKSELMRQASTDELTGLMNRRQFDAVLQRSVAIAQRDDVSHSLCYMDLDQFKVVNDTCGHVAGDEMLRQVARLLRDQVRRGDSIARLGGDEFALLLNRCTTAQAERVTENLLAAISGYRFVWQQRIFSVGISIGVVALDSSTDSAATALADADSACYEAKDAGRNRVHVYRADDRALSSRREQVKLVNDIDAALAGDRFVLHTQEIRPVDGAANRARHFEVLVRMQDERGELVPPGQFLPVAERYNLISRIDRWVIDATLTHLASHPSLLRQVRQCSVNLSGQSLGDEKFIHWLLQLLDATEVPTSKLCFEVTETAAIANLHNAMDLISELRKRECTLALDDFGSGFSSLAYLKTLSFDYLKIDGMFVRDIIDDAQDHSMVRLINEIGQTMGMQTIAEFVESDQIRTRLADLGVDFVQGFAIDEPQSIDRLSAALSDA